MTPRQLVIQEISFRLRRPWYLLPWVLDRVADKYYDWRFAIASSQRRSLAELGIDRQNCVEYQPVSYWDFWSLMKAVPIDPQRDGFLDFGSGAGRAVCLAATYPFRKVIGVDISPELNALAKANIDRTRLKRCCHDIQIITSDATEFAVPADATVFFFFHPFDDDVLIKVLDNVAKSARGNPRPIRLLYYGSAADRQPLAHFDHCDWLTRASTTFLPTGRLGVVYAHRA